MKKDKFPQLTSHDRLSLLGYAKYMGYEFDYSPEKNRAVLIKTDNDQRKVLYIAKERGKLIGIDKDGAREILTDQMNITKSLHSLGIFKIPENASMGINEFILSNLKIIGAK